MELLRRLAGLPFMLLAVPFSLLSAICEAITAFILTTVIQILGEQSSPSFPHIKQRLSDLVSKLQGKCPECDRRKSS